MLAVRRRDAARARPPLAPPCPAARACKPRPERTRARTAGGPARGQQAEPDRAARALCAVGAGEEPADHRRGPEARPARRYTTARGPASPPAGALRADTRAARGACRAISRETLLLLKSREVVAINQDPLGVAGDLVWKQGPKEVRAGPPAGSHGRARRSACARGRPCAQVWAAPLAGGGRAVALFNKHVASDDNFPATEMTVYWGQVGLPGDAEVRPRPAPGRSARR